MRTTGIGIVHHDDVAVTQLMPDRVHDGARGTLHRCHEDRQSGFALRHHFKTLRIDDRIGAVRHFGNHRREGGAGMHQIHLIGHLLQAAANDGEIERVHAQPSWVRTREPKSVSVAT